MPLPTAWHPVPNVGAARSQGSRFAPCSYPKIGGLLRRRQPRHGQIRPLPMREVRCAHVRELPKKAAAAPHTRQTHGDRTRQRQVPPRRALGALAQEVPGNTDLALLAAIQSAVGSHRTSLEVGPSHGNTQPVLCNSGRSPQRGRNLLRPLAETQHCVAQIMRHYLSRYV